MARCMLGNLPSFLWGEAMNTAIYTLNRCPTKAVEGKTPYEAWTGNKPNISQDRKSTRLNSSHSGESRMPSSA